MLPDLFIQQLKQYSDIERVVSGYVQLKKKGRYLVGLCPFHSEKSGSFFIYPQTQSFYCFGCGAGGDVITFIRRIENLEYMEAVKFLADKCGLEVPENGETDSRTLLKKKVLEINRESARFFHNCLMSDQGKGAYQYLIERGRDRKTIRHFGLGYAPDDWYALVNHLKSKGYTEQEMIEANVAVKGKKGNAFDRFRNRVMFPIIDLRGNVVAFGGRALDDKGAKYLNSSDTPVFKKSKNLFALNFAKTSKYPGLILAEGYMDVIAIHQAGFDNAVASLGTSLTSGHASLLKRYTKEVYLTYDSDGAGVKAALRAIPILKEVGIITKVINMQPYKDPDEFIKALGTEEYQKRIDQAENSFLFEIRMLEQNYDMNDPESKTAFYNETARRLLAFPEELERNNYIQAVADKYRIGFEDLRKLVNNLAMAGSGIKKAAPLKSGIHEKKKEDGMKQSQKLLLTWLIEDTRLFDSIKGWITEEDFTEPLYRKAAQELFTQYGESGQVNPAKIISRFQEEEEQKEIAGLFNAKIHEVETKQDKEKALKETIERIKENSIDVRSRQSDPNDLTVVMQLINEQKELEKLKKTHISID